MIAERPELPIRVCRTIHACQLRSQEPDLLCLVANTLQVSDRLDDGDDQPQIAGCRRARRQDTAAFLIDTDFDVVDLVIVMGNLQAEFAVPAHDRRDRARQLRLDQATHRQDVTTKVLDILVESARNMATQIRCFHELRHPVSLN